MTVTLKSRLPQIASELQARVSAGTKAGAAIIEARAKERVPVRSGRLKDAIHTEFKGSGDWSVVAGNRDVFYGHLIEFGTTRAPAHPFLVPALESSRAEVEKAITLALRTLR